MQRTEHYRLNQPEPSDNYNIADANENMAAIDGALHSLEEGKANRAENPAAGNLASLDALGNPVDSGMKPGDFAPASHLADRANPHQVTVAQIGAAPSSHLESKGHMFQVTAALTPAGALELTGGLPADKDGLTVQFVSPAAATDGLQMKFAGSDTLYPILTTGEGKEPIQAGAWDQGVPVTLTVSGGSCFFKAGGQGFPPGWNEKGQGIAWDDITKNSPIVQREYGKMEDGLILLSQPDILPPSNVTSIAISPDGKYLAVTCYNAVSLLVYKIANGKLSKLPSPATLPPSTSECVSFSPDGKYLAVANGGTSGCHIYKIENDVFSKLADIPKVGGAGKSCCFSPDGNYLAVTYVFETSLGIFKRTGDVFTPIPNPSSMPGLNGYDCCFSTDGKYFAVGSGEAPYFTLYSVNGEVFTKIGNPSSLPNGVISGCSFAEGSAYLALTSYTSPYIFVYKNQGNSFTKLPGPNTLPSSYGRHCRFSPDGKYLAFAAASSPYLYICDREGDSFTVLPTLEGLPTTSTPGGAFGKIAFSQNMEYFSFGYWETPFFSCYLNRQGTYIHTLNEINKEYFEYAPKGKIGIANESKEAGETVRVTLFPALYNLTDNGNGGN